MKRFIGKMSLLMIVMITSSLSVHASQELYPFKKNPELSWSEFEKNFRQTYKHLTIPRIVTCDSDEFVAMAVYKEDDVDLPRINEVTGVKQEVPFIIIKPTSQSFKSTQLLEAVLLHETGHHYRKEELEKSHARAKKIGLGAVGSTLVANAGLALYNVNLLTQKTWSGKALFAQAVALTLFYQRAGIRSFVDDIFGTRPEEYAADTFAHEHATKEALIAYRDYYSKQSKIEDVADSLFEQKEEHLKKRVLDGLSNPTVPVNYEGLSDQEQWTVYVGKLLCDFTASLGQRATALDFTHPSHEIRWRLADKALQERFGNESK